MAGDAVIAWSDATGFVVAGAENGDGTWFWRSDDGLRWQRAESFPNRDDAHIRALIPGGPGMIAAGAVLKPLNDTTGLKLVSRNITADPLDQPYVYRAAVWTSSDGLHWERIADQTAFEPDPSLERGLCRGTEIEDIAEGPAGFVAIGIAYGGDCEGPDSLLWRSSDALAWQTIPIDSAVSKAHDSELTAGAPGYLGYLGAPIFSADGRHWKVSIGPDIHSAVWTGDRFVGVGEDKIYASRDGRDWRRVSTVDFRVDWSLGLVRVEGGLVLVGTEETADGFRVHVLTSTDGETWVDRTGDPALEGVRDVRPATDGRRIVLLGFAGEVSGTTLVTDQLP